MSPETRARVKAFRQALELAAGERATEPVPALWRDDLKWFPRGCCELASQTLVRYLKDHDKNRFPSIMALAWDEGEVAHGHVFVALDGEYIDLTLDQFDGFDDWVASEPTESGGQVGDLIRKVRALGGTITSRELTLDVVPGHGHQLYDWLKNTADSLKVAESGNGMSGSLPVLVSTDILPEYRNWSPAGPSAKAAHVPEKKRRPKMTHEGTITECYKPRHVRLRETSTQWVSECGLRFRKSTGAAVGSGVWSANRLDLSSIREIRSDE